MIARALRRLNVLTPLGWTLLALAAFWLAAAAFTVHLLHEAHLC